MFHEAFNGKRWPKFNSEKICEIKYAKIQGSQALDGHFKEKRAEAMKSNFGTFSPLNSMLGIRNFGSHLSFNNESNAENFDHFSDSQFF